MSKPASFGQSLYRLTVMAGTLFVGAMAAYLYGPPPERVADLMNVTMSKLSEVVSRLDEHRDSIPASTQAEGFVAQNSPEPALFQHSPTEISADSVAPPSNPQPILGVDHAELLRQAGATQASVVPWGSDSSLYRAAARVPISTSGLTRQLDAIAETPEAAVQAVLAQLNR